MSLGERPILVIDDQLARENDVPGQPSRFSFERSVAPETNVFQYCTGQIAPGGAYAVSVIVDFVRKHTSQSPLILLDVMFGDRDIGRRALPEIRAAFPSLPVVMMTSERPSDNGREYLRLGAIDYIIKPIQQPYFWRTIRRYMSPDPQKWLVGQHDLYRGAILAAASLAERGNHLLIQGESAEQRTAFAEFAARASGAKELRVVEVREMAPAALTSLLFGRSVDEFEKAPQPDDKGWLARSRETAIMFVGVDALPIDVQTFLASFLSTRANAQSGPLIVASTTEGLGRLAQEDRFNRTLFEIFNGSFAINVPPSSVRSFDLLLRLSAVGLIRTGQGQAFDEQDEQALSDGLRRVSVRDYAAWEEQVLATVRANSGRAFRDNVLESSITDARDRLSLPSYSEVEIESSAEKILVEIRLQELGLIVSAFRASGGNRARAATLLKCASQGKASTVYFDRWFQQIWKSLPIDVRNAQRQAQPILEDICQALRL